MTERKPGPVKPPVIDLTARPAEDATEAAAEKPAAAEQKPESAKVENEAAAANATARRARLWSAAPEGTAAPDPAASSADAGKHWRGVVGGGLGGALLAIAVCYGLASAGYWPDETGDRVTVAENRLDAVEKSAATNAAAINALGQKLDGAQTDLDGKLDDANQAIDKLQKGFGAVQAQAGGADLKALQDQVKTLSSRLDAVAAGASSADAGAISANLATTQKDVATLSQRISSLAGKAAATDDRLTQLQSTLDAARAAIDKAAAAPTPQAIAAAMQLPLRISALEADFAAGRPFADDLKALQAAVPEAKVPASVAGAAASGLPAPGELADAFEARMPALMAAAPGPTDDSWQAQLGNWVKSALALRRQGPQAGDSPDAVLSRLEAAVARHDFTDAETLLGQLPAPMQQAAGPVAGQLQALAEADSFLADLRHKALAPAAGVEQ